MLGAYFSLVMSFLILVASIVTQVYLRYFASPKNPDFVFLNTVGFLSIFVIFMSLVIIYPDKCTIEVDTKEEK